MHKTGKNILLFLIYLQTVIAYAAPADSLYHSGLTFQAHTVNQDKRTGLDLTPERPLSFRDNAFSIEFDLSLRYEYHTYGNVLRVVSDDRASFDLIVNLLTAKASFVLNEMKDIVASEEITDTELIKDNTWIHVKIQFNKRNIRITLNGKEIILNHSFDNFKQIRLYWGSNKHSVYYTTDVPPITVRNIRIYDAKERLVRDWRMSRHQQNEVFDEVGQNKATVTNGVWEIDKHRKWQKVTSFTFTDEQPQIAYDYIQGRIFIALQQKLYTYLINENQTESVEVNKGNPFPGVSRQIIYDPDTDRLISYTTDDNRLNYYDFTSHEWMFSTDLIVDKKQHHNHLIDPLARSLILFNGYGHHLYEGEKSQIALNGNSGWEISSTHSFLAPRYLTALGIEDEDHVLLLGGHGSLSGKQEESPRNFYDLYRVNLRTNEYTKLWEYDNTGENYTFGNSMVIDKQNNKIYALAYNNDRYHSRLWLYSSSIEGNPSPAIVSDFIEYDFLDVQSYCDLFLFENKLYAILLQEKTPGIQSIDVYSLAFPPLSESFFEGYISDNRSVNKGYILIIVGLLVSGIIVGVWMYRKKRSIGIVEEKFIEADNKRKDLPDQESVVPIKTKTKSSVLLLGGFQVFDSEGENITVDFTPTLKQLFLFLLLNSVKNEKGTTSQRLDETFWFDMSKASATNNRSVNIRKLRLLLQKIGDIDITSKNSYWYVRLGETVFCDYKNVIELISGMEKDNEAGLQHLPELIRLATAGELLPGINVEWVDKYKAEYSTRLIELLQTYLHLPEVQKDNKLLLKIADVILICDTLEEDAIKIKCKLLYQMGQKGLSKQSYDKFCQEYERLLQTSPSFSYESIIQ